MLSDSCILPKAMVLKALSLFHGDVATHCFTVMPERSASSYDDALIMFRNPGHELIIVPTYIITNRRNRHADDGSLSYAADCFVRYDSQHDRWLPVAVKIRFEHHMFYYWFP